MRETVLLCKPYPMQRLLVLCILTLARRMQGNDGLSLPATVGVDKLPHTTEPGLSVWSFKRGLRLSFFVPENLIHHFFRNYSSLSEALPCCFMFFLFSESFRNIHKRTVTGISATSIIILTGFFFIAITSDVIRNSLRQNRTKTA